MNKSFLTAFAATMLMEGGYIHDLSDPGGETYFGISRVYWPNWEGWEHVDKAVNNDNNFDIQILQPMVRKFYTDNFWNQFMGDDISKVSEKVAIEVFDTSVNMSVHNASCFLQDSLNLLNINEKLYPDIIVDGKVGRITVSTLQLYILSTKMLVKTKEKMISNVMNTLQGMHYIGSMRKNPRKEKYRGWFLRL